MEGEQRPTVATRANTVYGLKRSAKLPAKSPSESSGTPWTRFAQRHAPEKRRTEAAVVFTPSQAARQRGSSLLLRHSNETDAHDQQHQHEQQREIEA